MRGTPSDFGNRKRKSPQRMLPRGPHKLVSMMALCRCFARRVKLCLPASCPYLEASPKPMPLTSAALHASFMIWSQMILLFMKRSLKI